MVRLAAVVGAVLAAAGALAAQHYASKYDHVDVETILNNRRMVNYYAACLLSRGPCPPEGVEFKRILPEALQTNCARCTEKQKTVTLRTIRRLKKEYPKIWSELAAQWDPEDIYVKKFESTFSTQGKPVVSPVVINRFAETEDDVADNTITQTFSTTLSLPSSTPTKPKITTTSTTTSTATSTTTTTATTTSTTTTAPTASPSFTNPASGSATKSPKPPVRPRPNIGERIGANIEATVSFGTNIVEGLVKGLGAIGSRVVETGAEVAGVIIKNLARPL